jgi:hypothetical protein
MPALAVVLAVVLALMGLSKPGMPLCKTPAL